MEWITDRAPNSPGIYAVYLTPNIYDPKCFGFAYFDGFGWLLAHQSGTDIFPYRGNPVWSVIDWGNDES
jgi:hypothetical protein